MAKEIKAAEDPKLKKRLEAELLRVQEEAKKAWAAVHEKRDEAREVIEPLTQTSIATINATPLAKLGGVFNCISFSV